MRSNSKVNVVAFLPGVALALFFTPFTFAEGIEHQLNLLDSIILWKFFNTFPSSNLTLMCSGTSFPEKSADAVWKFTVKLK